MDVGGTCNHVFTQTVDVQTMQQNVKPMHAKTARRDGVVQGKMSPALLVQQETCSEGIVRAKNAARAYTVKGEPLTNAHTALVSTCNPMNHLSQIHRFSLELYFADGYVTEGRGAVSIDDCKACEMGKFRDRGPSDAVCVECDRGKFSDEKATEGKCPDCPTGEVIR